MKTQYQDWTLEDIDIKTPREWPNWVKVGYNSKSQAIEGILKFMSDRQGLFDGLGLQGVPVKRAKKKK